jgi:MSHA pilin protein MshC
MELLVIVVLLGILSVAVFARFNPAPFRAAGFEQEVRAAIRFAQKFAIESGCEVEVDISGAGYALRIRDDAAGTLPCQNAVGAFGTGLPNPSTGSAYAGAPPSGVMIGSLAFIYDRQGRPSAGGAVAVGAKTVTVEAGTGFVH